MPIRTPIYQGRRRTSHVISDAHVDGVHYIQTVEHDDEALAQNARIRSAELLRQGAKNPLMDGGIVEYAFSIPSTYQWARWKKEHPDIAALLFSASDEERRQGARMLAIQHPEWVTSTGKL